MSFKVPEAFRVQRLGYESKHGDPYGVFEIPFESFRLFVLATDGKGITAKDGIEWEHVSISLKSRTPNWKEMCFIKSLFWDEEDCVIQYHPPKEKYINHHPNVLHLWRPNNKEVPMPPLVFV
jgi:hypothetical protein